MSMNPNPDRGLAAAVSPQHHAYWKALIQRHHPDLDDSAADRLADEFCATHPGFSVSTSKMIAVGQQPPKPNFLVHWGRTHVITLWATILFLLLALICAVTVKAQGPNGSTNGIDVFFISNAGTRVYTVAAPFTLNFGSNITTSVSGNTVTVNASGGSGTFNQLTGDASSTPTGGATEVLGLLNNALPSLATGYLNWTGSAWALSTPSGSGNVNGSGTSVAGNFAVFTNTSSTAIGPGSTAYGPASFLQVANNLSDLNSASSARTNLGLGALAVAGYPSSGVVYSSGAAFSAATSAEVQSAIGSGVYEAYLGYTPTNAAVVPSTVPSAGQLLIGNTGGTAYAPVSLSGDCTVTYGGAITCTKSNGTAFGSGAFAAAYTLPAATTSTLGGVKTDGSTISNSSGLISCTTATSSQVGCMLLGASGGADIYGSASTAQSNAETFATNSGSSNTINATQVNGATVPVSAYFAGTNSSRQIVAATAANLASFLAALTGCTTAGYAYVPADGQCEAAGGGGGDTITSPNSTITVGGTSSATTLDIALGHANTWTGAQTLDSPVLVTPALGTPASGAITNLTGTCSSCTANAVSSITGAQVGTAADLTQYDFYLSGGTSAAPTGLACTADKILEGSATTPSCTATPQIGASGTLGSLTMGNATSGTITLEPATGALGTITEYLPIASGDTLAGIAATQTLTNKSIAGSEINSSTVGPTYGGTGQNESSATGVGQWSSGTYSVSTALPNGTTATTQTTGDNTTKVATDAFVLANAGGFTAGGDLSGSSTSQEVIGLHTVPFCTGFTPTTGQYLEYTTASSPNPCYTAATPSGSGNMVASGTWVDGDLGQTTNTSGTAQVDSGVNYNSSTGTLTTPQTTSPDVMYMRPGSGATNPTYSQGWMGPSAPTSSQIAYQFPNVAPTAGQYMSFGAPSAGVSAVTWTGPFTTVLTSNQTTTSSTAATLGLSLPTVPGSTSVAGECTLRYEASSASDAVQLFLYTSAAPTGFYVNGSTRYTTTSAVVNQLPLAVVTTSVATAITTSADVATATTFYRVDVPFSLVTASGTPVTITVYGSIASSGTLTLGAGSSCSWHP